MSDDLATWLTQIWDEEQRLAKRAGDALMTPEIDNYGHLTVPSSWMLARIAADREILIEHREVGSTIFGGPTVERWRYCETCQRADEDVELVWPCKTVKLLASPYADRPGYREEWRL